ncbi:MAG: DUF1684 domain-containing protein [Candidatus Acidiferrales bacterium]
MIETFRPKFTGIFLPAVVALSCLLALPTPARPQAPAPGADPAYRSSVEKWRQDYEADLKSDHGWLTISGLFWLHEGENTFGSDPLNDIVLPENSAPPEAGTFELRGSTVTAHIKSGVSVMRNGVQVETVELQPDSPSDRLVIGGLTLWVHASGGRQTIRMQDKNSALRREFTGLHWFPIDESYRVPARYVPYDTPKNVPIQNLAGDSLALPISGFVTFILRGQELRLEASADQTGALSFVIRDLTSGKETYAASRFLDTEPPKGDVVILDFNQAYNPPCAYNPNTTCPLPPPGNRLRVRIEAGEKIYRREH